jgi:mRNA interferase MazF
VPYPNIVLRILMDVYFSVSTISYKQLKNTLMATIETPAFFNENGELITPGLPAIKNREVKLLILFRDDADADADNIAVLSKSYTADEPDYGGAMLNEPDVEYNAINEGDIALVELPHAGAIKLRPALILKRLPTFNDYLVCGISTQQHHYIDNFDEIVDESDPLFPGTGLHKSSIIRLSSLAVFSRDKILNSIGKIPPALHQSLLKRLADFILA